MKKISLALVCLMVFSAVALAADIEMKPVQSSLLDKVGYDPETKTLTIQMNNSSDVYCYEDVPQSVYDNLMAADSKGAFYVKQIKRHYKSSRK